MKIDYLLIIQKTSQGPMETKENKNDSNTSRGLMSYQRLHHNLKI